MSETHISTQINLELFFLHATNSIRIKSSQNSFMLAYQTCTSEIYIRELTILAVVLFGFTCISNAEKIANLDNSFVETHSTDGKKVSRSNVII